MNRKNRRSAAPRRNSIRATARPTAAPSGAMPERGLKIGEAAQVIGVETYVLRFWETQFQFLKPRHSRTKHRFYHEHDLEVLRLVKRLLHQEGFTIAGANKYVRENGLESLLAGKAAAVPQSDVGTVEAEPKPAIEGQTRRVLTDLRRELESLHKMLE